MKKTGTTAPMVFRLALLCMGLLLISGLAYPTAAGAQARGKDDVPEQLWQIYPLDPTKTDAGAPQTAQPQPPPPGPQTQTDSAVQTTSESPKAQAQPSGDSDSGRSLAFPLLGAVLGLLVGLLVVAAARNGAFAIAGEYLARASSPLVSPLRETTNAHRYVARGGATVVSPLRALSSLPRRIGLSCCGGCERRPASSPLSSAASPLPEQQPGKRQGRSCARGEPPSSSMSS
jgi:hypothetical protein